MMQEYIIYETHEGERKITIINSQPYYCSTGKNSHNPGRWYPFLGIKTAKADINSSTTKYDKDTLRQFNKYKNTKPGFILKGSYIQGTPVPVIFEKKTYKN